MIKMDSTQLLKLFPQENFSSLAFNFVNVVIDSREPCKGALFVAIKGDNFDGHEFVGTAYTKGAVAALVEHQLDIAIPQIIVPDCKRALATIANTWRRQLKPTVVAITGSNGKTTVKEMLGQILSSIYPTLKTAGNLNNDIGVPLTLFRLSTDDQFAVIEMGANHINEIRQLLKIADAEIVYVNNAQSAHVEGFGSLQKVIEAKGEMYEFCSSDAVAVFNDDEKAVKYWQTISATEKKLSFSMRHNADVEGGFTQQQDSLLINVKYQGEEGQSGIQVSGEHNAQNALAAITLALGCGLSLKQACEGLNGFNGVDGRQKFLKGINDCLIIDDSYNANPDSLSAAVKVLCAQQGEAWLALGDMAELGKNSMSMHEQAVKEANHAGVKKFFAFGEQSCRAAKVFGEDGFCFNNQIEMADYLTPRLHRQINLLVKGSRSSHMEKVVAALAVKSASNGLAGERHAL
jgi:UDP-N-acetylmuramoyl-tripeptide--D-alanyl-D-alanine ligase